MNLLDIRSLNVNAMVEGEPRAIVEDLSLTIAAGEALGLVGESGSGKSMTARSVLRLLSSNVTAEGHIDFDGRDVLAMSARQLRAYRRSDVSMIFQDPRSAINPVRTVGDFLTEGLRKGSGISRDDAIRRAVDAMRTVGISRPEDRLHQYPHEFSGGMLQRVMICSALLADTRLILADEPTTALDVTTQAEVVGLLDTLRRERGLALLFITHDLDLAAAITDRVCVMYAGRIVESRAAGEFESRARHPYSRALFQARPSVERRVHRLPAIGGSPVAASEVGQSCSFAPRCAYAQDRCREQLPQVLDVNGGEVRCLRAHELDSLLLEGTA